ncbi:MAG TPA: ABC-2 family transporter protein [Candidatus Eremiobacteraceae bacterium]|nr:ABC-2 family transporter protein [Candidatus Eremiobacteraceae bacterium]
MADAGSRYWSSYREFWRLNLLTVLEYKANFFIWLLFTVVYHGVALGAIWIILTRFPSLQGWDRADVFFLYALWMVGHTLSNTLFFTVGDVPDAIQEGRFDRFLVRPLDPLFQVVTQPGQIFPDELIVAMIVFGFAAYFVHLQWSAMTAVVLPFAVIGGCVIDASVQLAVAAISFWVIRLDALRWVVMSLENDFTRFPLTMYGRAVRVVLGYVVPFAFMNYFPATVLLAKTADGAVFNPLLGWLTPAAAALWFAIAYSFWRAGLNKYQGTGS